MTSDLTPIIAVTIVCAIAGFRIGQHRGRPLTGFLLGLFLAVIGLVILAFVPATAHAPARQATGKHRAGREAPQRLATEQAQQGAGYPSPAYPPQAPGAFALPASGQWEPPPAR